MTDVDSWIADAEKEAAEKEKETAEVVPFRKKEPYKGKAGVIVDTPPIPVARGLETTDAANLPRRAWVYGKHLLRKAYSTTVAPGAASKSTLVQTEFIAMATGRPLLGVHVEKPLKVWYINLEEEFDELQRRAHATMSHHGISASELKGRYYMSGSECELMTAVEGRDGVQIVTPVWDALIAYIKEMRFDAIAVDPFAQSHNVAELNEPYKTVIMEWRKLAQECNCAVELVHHTRKGNGQDLSSQDARGGSALVNHARDGRVLNKATDEKKRDLGVDPVRDRATYFTITSDKPNYSTGHYAQWHRTVGIEIGNGDEVATVETFTPPDAFDGISTADTLAVQRAVDDLEEPRADAQAAAWVGYTIAEVLGLDADDDCKRIKTMLKDWLKAGIFEKKDRMCKDRKTHPVIVVGEWINDV